MEIKFIIIALFCMAAGLFSLLSSIYNWDFFFNHRKARFWINIIGRKATRIIYGIIGFLLIGAGIAGLLGGLGLIDIK